MIKTLDDYLQAIENYRVAVAESCWPADFKNFAEQWFQIAPHKARQYGVECWLILGAKALFADLNANYYRWKTMREQEHDPDDMHNAILDAFGYTMMLTILLERPLPAYASGVSPHSEWRVLKLLLWDHDDSELDAPMFALGMVVGMWEDQYMTNRV